MSKAIEDYKSKLLEVIKSNRIFFIEELFSFQSIISRSQFYNLGLNKSDILLKAMADNKTVTKKNMQNKWYRSDNATLQIALFKLLADDDERKKLSQQFTDVTSNGETVGATIVFEDKPTE